MFEKILLRLNIHDYVLCNSNLKTLLKILQTTQFKKMHVHQCLDIPAHDDLYSTELRFHPDLDFATPKSRHENDALRLDEQCYGGGF